MTKKRSKRTALPRLTVLAYSRRDLQRFVDSCELLAARVLDLEAQVQRLSAQTDRLTCAGRRRARPATGRAGDGPTEEGEAHAL
jgi:hypothetical protein